MAGCGCDLARCIGGGWQGWVGRGVAGLNWEAALVEAPTVLDARGKPRWRHSAYAPGLSIPAVTDTRGYISTAARVSECAQNPCGCARQGSQALAVARVRASRADSFADSLVLAVERARCDEVRGEGALELRRELSACGLEMVRKVCALICVCEAS